jgi:Zn-finger nucleic acid-binding protein
MRCPRCSAELRTEEYKGIEVDRCPDCQGLWLDYTELDQLEDVVLDEDEVKGTLTYDPLPSDISCPKCEGPMRTFSYRGWNL